MTWLYNHKPLTETPDEYQGFVYLITNIQNNRKYIGKKNFWTTHKLKPLKGKTNRRHRRRATDWQAYCGSCEELLKDIDAHGPNTLRKEILHLCANKNQMTYWEMKLQFDYNVLLDDSYYNGYIGGRLTARGLI
jgi:hypothetical protein